MITHQSGLFGIGIDAISMHGAIVRILGWLDEPLGPCRYVVTPNVNHVVTLHRSPAFRRAYRDASMVLADGRPILWASRMLGCPLPDVVPGSDLVPGLFDYVAAAGRRVRIYLLGAAPGVAQRASGVIQDRWPGVTVAGLASPPYGFEHAPGESEKILADIAAARPDILIVGLGAPKQERWIHANRHRVAAKVALCVGAAIDFLAGEKPRAPRWMRENGLEWLHRVMSEPRRLARRYAHDALVFPGLLARELLAARDESGSRDRASSAPASRMPIRPVAQLVNLVDSALGNRATRLLQFLGASSGAEVSEVAFAYASMSAALRKRRVLLLAADDPDVELGVLDCLQHGQSLQQAIRPVSGTLCYAALRGSREPDRAACAMVADDAFWARLRENFDEIIIVSRTPHASQFGLNVASRADAVMLVVDGEQTLVSRARDVLNDLRGVGAHVLGTVMSA